LFGGGGGVKSKIMRRVAGMAGVPDLGGLSGDESGDLPTGLPPTRTAPSGPSRKKLKKKRKKKRH